MPVVMTEKSLSATSQPSAKASIEPSLNDQKKPVGGVNGQDYDSVPDLAGLSVREVLEQMKPYAPKLQIFGAGVAYSQTPKAGEKASANTKLKVYFRN